MSLSTFKPPVDEDGDNIELGAFLTDAADAVDLLIIRANEAYTALFGTGTHPQRIEFVTTYVRNVVKLSDTGDVYR